MKVVQDRRGRPLQCWELPGDAALFSATWWRIRDAARAWRCSPTTAKRLIDRYPVETGAFCVVIKTRRGCSCRVVVPVGTGAPALAGKGGNPYFTDAQYQRELAMRRWQPGLPTSGYVARMTRAAQCRRADRRRAALNRRLALAQDEAYRRRRMQYEAEFTRKHVLSSAGAAQVPLGVVDDP